MTFRRPAVVVSLVLAACAAGAVAVATSLAAPSPAAADEPAPTPADPVAEATRLRDEARPLFRTAGDPDADQPERSRARKDCYRKLKAAKKLLDDHIAAHPDAAEALDPLYCEISATMFWLKKEMTLEEMKELTGKGGPAPASPGASGSPGPASPPGPGGSGIGGATSREPRGPGGDGTGPGGAPGTSPGPSAPPTEPSAPPPPAPPSPADELARVESYAHEHPGDLPGQYEAYEDFLARFPDPAAPEYGKAATVLQSLGTRMKDVYRSARDEDPDSLRSEDPAETQRRLKQLLTDLASTDEVVRARAAKFLGYLGSPDAAPPLLDAAKESRAGPVYDAAVQALAGIGGRRVFDRLVKTAQKDSKYAQTVTDVLGRALAAGGPGGRLAGDTLAAFAEEHADEFRTQAIEALKSSGKTGAVGLARAATWAPEAQRAELITLAGAHKEPRSAAWLARFLFASPSGMRKEQAWAARDAIEAIGRPGVRYLIPALDEPTVQLWTAEMLRKITGTKQKDDKRKTWEAWFRKNRRSMEE